MVHSFFQVRRYFLDVRMVTRKMFVLLTLVTNIYLCMIQIMSGSITERTGGNKIRFWLTKQKQVVR